MQEEYLEYRMIPSRYGNICLVEELCADGLRRIIYCGFIDGEAHLKKLFPNQLLQMYGGSQRLTLNNLLLPDKNLLDRLYFKGSPLELEVWQRLLLLPRNRLISYSDLAASTSHPKAVRAVATCVGKNPISLIIPCHLVVRKEAIVSLRNFGNYYWGVEIKSAIINDILNGMYAYE